MPRGKPFTKGDPRAGRPHGSKNKVTQSIREAFKEAFDKMGGADALFEWGMKKENRATFYQMVTKLIPQEVTGSNGAPLIQVINDIAPKQDTDAQAK